MRDRPRSEGLSLEFDVFIRVKGGKRERKEEEEEACVFGKHRLSHYEQQILLLLLLECFIARKKNYLFFLPVPTERNWYFSLSLSKSCFQCHGLPPPPPPPPPPPRHYLMSRPRKKMLKIHFHPAAPSSFLPSFTSVVMLTEIDETAEEGERERERERERETEREREGRVAMHALTATEAYAKGGGKKKINSAVEEGATQCQRAAKGRQTAKQTRKV